MAGRLVRHAARFWPAYLPIWLESRLFLLDKSLSVVQDVANTTIKNEIQYLQ